MVGGGREGIVVRERETGGEKDRRRREGIAEREGEREVCNRGERERKRCDGQVKCVSDTIIALQFCPRFFFVSSAIQYSTVQYSTS